VSRNPFLPDTLSTALLHRAAYTVARPFLSWLMKAETFADLYRRVAPSSSDSFMAQALRVLDIGVLCNDRELARVPADGPLIVAANHPLGGVDGLVLGAALRRVRGDVRLLANHLLARVPELRDTCFFVDPFDGPDTAARNLTGLRAAHLWVKHGGALVIFPAGEVAHRRTAAGDPIDSPWHTTVGRLALSTGARVVPAYVAGSNSGLFYAAGRLHPGLRTALLPRELLNKRGRRFSIRLGEPVLASDAKPVTAAAATRELRARVEDLAPAVDPPARVDRGDDAVSSEISSLPQHCLLAESGSFQVFCAAAPEIPRVLNEIGRLRASAYRSVGEGSDRTIDLDRFDGQYLHLFSWDRGRRLVVGAYRIGRTDEIVAAGGVDGLYTRTLFRYDRRLIDSLSPALELGRSFVRAEYQRSYAALLLLWKGIGRFVVQHPEYRVLFGPVSISARYSDSSHAMLKAFLEQNHCDGSLGELVEAVHPFAPRSEATAPMASVPATIEEADRLIATLESDGKGMPVLLRQYLKLNARLIGFNVDPDFGDAVDALMMVDLPTVDPAILGRYLGPHDADRFLAHHRQSGVFRAA
jgi:putative hemolysin